MRWTRRLRGLGIMGGPMAANLARRASSCPSTRARARRRRLRRGARRPRRRDPARGRRGRLRGDHDGPRRAGGRGGPARRGRRRARPRTGRARDRHVHDRPHRGARHRRAARRRRRGLPRGPRLRLRPKAEDGTLTIMVGGERRRLRARPPAFDAMGERIVHVGPQGHAQLAKLLTNTMGAVHAAALAEAVLAAERRASTPTRSSRWPPAAPATPPSWG